MLEKWEGHQLLNVDGEITTPVPPGILVAVSVAVLYREFTYENEHKQPVKGRNAVLASLRADYPVWEFAGGKVDAGETPREAAVREIKEELGLDIHNVNFARAMLVLRKDKSYLMQFYVAEPNPREQIINTSEREVKETSLVTLAMDKLRVDMVWWPATREAWSDIQHTARKMTEPEHVCGLTGYNPMIDPPCPACEYDRKTRPPEGMAD